MSLVPCRPTPNFATARFTDDSNTTLLTTAQFLRFNADRADTLFVPGHVDVRGIPCEKWTQYANSSSDSSAQYNTSFFFPVSQWLTAREDYHRLLAQIQLTGTRNGSNISHFYNYVNFRARNQSASIFDPCMIAPQVSMLLPAWTWMDLAMDLPWVWCPCSCAHSQQNFVCMADCPLLASLHEHSMHWHCRC